MTQNKTDKENSTLLLNFVKEENKVVVEFTLL